MPEPSATNPAPTATTAPSPTPIPSPHRLTEGGCCPDPFWSPDGSQVLFLDRPSPDQPAGFWGASLQGGPPVLVSERLGIYSDDFRYLAYPQEGVTVIERLADRTRWNLANGARAVLFGPAGVGLAWTGGQSGPPFDTALRSIWTSALDGTNVREVLQVYGGGLVDWFPDGRLLVSGRLDPAQEATSLWAFSPQDGSLTELARASTRLRGTRLSPEGGRLAYQVLFTPQEGGNGLWLKDLNTGEDRPLALFGAYRWRDEDRLLVIPLEVGAGHELWQIDAATGSRELLIDPAIIPFKIAKGDWAVSPDGNHLAWVSAFDENIWVIELPD